MMIRGWAVIAACGWAVSGCSLYFGEDCEEQVTEPTETRLRNPDTGLCETFTTGGGDACDDGDDDTALPGWGACDSDCDSLEEAACLRSSGCRAAYVGGAFAECWAVDTAGAGRTGGCNGLDALDCSRQFDCVAVHASGDPVGGFRRCEAEPGGCFFSDGCADGEFCNAADECLPHGCSEGCESPCYGFCAPDDDPNNFGSCTEEPLCSDPAPECPEGTQPGVRHGCWTGFCIPDDAC